MASLATKALGSLLKEIVSATVQIGRRKRKAERKVRRTKINLARHDTPGTNRCQCELIGVT